ncbi:aldo/keto reductase [Truepera radiovictrix]|jgi:aryl-alcohol dehydrogenase-like predicted oxidoreductase|uniref:Aldo/keto reductase n=1 Tax=Truepera radiovictrix (strain DSM 17093 / CIP 108686 / LMG 22925 / RQ-24) TaxID=649638 RepID=D7CSF9_TRURR|nr:aldo/keto reductase [Truepera radiovictrix]ADI15379.1 aldo/keto reductase [Truepera radiovictrix DSM 17093]WMT56070.1 aldo/keto reductase [Truepera radiovictrix]
MHYRQLGKTGIRVSEIGFGAWGIGGGWGERDDTAALAALERALEEGITFIDTALGYGEGHSERLIGQVVGGSDREVVIATKVPPKNRLWPARKGTTLAETFPKDYVLACTDQSLQNLGKEQVDVLQFHVWDDAWAHEAAWRETVEELKRSGRIRAFGLSLNDHEPENALAALETGLVDTVQVIYNIFDQTPAERLFPACERLGVGVIVRVPLDEGGLTGAITPETTFEEGDWRASYFAGERKAQVYERTQALAFLTEDGATLAEAALRFTLSHPAVSTVIPGMRSPARVAQNAAVSDGRLLSPEVLARLKDHAWPRNFYRAD